MTRCIRFALLTAALALLATTTPTTAPAAPRVETDPNKEYPCTPDCGAWVICVHEFRGPDADNLARQMALQIRQRDNLTAYVFNFSEQQKQQMEKDWTNLGKLNPDGTPRQVHVNIPDERVVLIGGFPSMEAATAALKDVKKLAKPQLYLPNKTTFDLVSVYEPTPDGKVQVRGAEVNPFPTSFVAPNPSIPHQQQAKKVDPILKTLNEDEEYSLLKNPKAWTLAVKEYAGDSMVVSHSAETNPSLLDKLFNPKKACQTLAATAMQAHELARWLRDDKVGFESYVLHTRRSSIVTVGSFTGPDDPKMQQTAELIQRFKLVSKDPRVPTMQLFAVPMEIPRP
jgi:hypothetical protein